MTRAALLVPGVRTLAACSGGGKAEPAPPLDTEAPTTRVEPTPITANDGVTSVLSTGMTGVLGIIPRPDSFPYDVDEVETVGTGR
jgi:hypothetical protein